VSGELDASGRDPVLFELAEQGEAEHFTQRVEQQDYIHSDATGLPAVERGAPVQVADEGGEVVDLGANAFDLLAWRLDRMLRPPHPRVITGWHVKDVSTGAQLQESAEASATHKRPSTPPSAN
jgi:hypothetical protein